MRRERMRQRIKQFCVWLLLLTLCLPVSGSTVKAEEVQHRTVRVGFYPVANYQEIRDDGTYTGFSYDYYMQIQKYTRWNYEFVEASYADCMQMLASGEIDVMAGVGRTPQREEQYLFSDYSVSNSQNKLYAKSDNEQLFYESYDTFEGCTIAMMKGMLQDEVESYSSKHDFTVHIREYDSLSSMEEALFAGEVDMLCASSITNDINTKIVARMDKAPLYYAVNKDEPEVAEELNDAMRKITDNNPDFYTLMSEKYMISGANATATFTREELAYIHSEKSVYVIVNDDWAPITWYDQESGSYKGIFIDVLEQIERYSGLNFEVCTEEEFNEKAANEPEILEDVVAILADDNSWAEQQKVMISNHVVDSSVVMVTKRGVHQENITDDMVVAIPDRFYIGYVMRDELADSKVVYYDTVEKCLDAVNSGKVDATYVNELVATYYLSKLEYSELFATANSGYYENLGFAVNKESEAPLLSILDKSLLCIGTNEIEQIVIQNSIAEQRASLKGLYYSNPSAVILVVVVTLAILFGVVFVIHNMVHQRQLAEQELKKEAENGNARTEFFMMISHELRTPLNAIVGYLNLIAEEHRKNGWEMEYVRRSQSAAYQLSDIAEDMLDYTRIASENVELHQELFDLKDVITNVNHNVAGKAEQKNMDYRLTIHNITHEYVISDRLRIAQIMQNLLENAVKFTEPGGMVESEVSEEVTEDGRLWIVFSCRDTGKGMTEEFLEKICAPFNQSDQSYSRTHGGLGLGLYLTRYFVQAMNGTLQVESKLNEGSCFTVRLPLTRPNSEQVLEHNVDCSHVRAIICTGNKEDDTHLRDLLKRLKIKCDVIADPTKLLKRIRSRIGGEYEYSLCIVDEKMVMQNKSEGSEESKEIAESKEVADSLGLLSKITGLEHAPTIFVTAGSAAHIQKLVADDRICEVIDKPVFQSVLFDAVMNVFGEYSMIQPSTPVADYSGIHAMIVEDNSVNADILTRVLHKANVQVTICENGQLALDQFRQSEEGEYQIIFMDIQMPVMNGYEAALQIRASRGSYGGEIPIVAVSANAFPEDIAKSLESGMNEHLSKPVDGDKLYHAIQKYCT